MTDQIKEYIEKLEEIRTRLLMSKTDLSRELNISYITMMRIYHPEPNLTFKTLKKIRDFVNEHSN